VVSRRLHPDQLIDDVAAVACLALGETRCVRHRYRDLFRTHLGLDPLSCSIDANCAPRPGGISTSPSTTPTATPGSNC
jgi:hypothetical protein